MKTKKQINTELLIIHELFPSNQTELHRETPFQLLVAVILSAQCTDKQVNKVTSRLFQIIKTPQDILNIGEDKLKEYIRSIGFFNAKARNIFKMSWQLLSKEYWWIIPSELSELVKLAWVGEKTAKVIAHQLYNGQYIAVDTHVHRVCNRLGWVQTKTAEQTSKVIEWLIDQENIYLAHHSLILFGRYHCTAKKPKCETCPLQKVCPYYKSFIVLGSLKE
jgi:endonuclease-3